ncbi:MAG: NADH-dependent [FeFe] hydrogenase, group A6 [Bacteroidales bacterium]|jgi:NADP-reducing hydrogenase subunit HndD|nr:NADH-dependent [FeFe] hydrogenase, group A6 [Bacteroidales bacterium]
MVKLTIDGKAVEAEAGSTILDTAKTVGIDIPTLCHMELKDMCIENKPAGCRICVVEVQGRRNLAPACATNVSEGMVIRTNSMRVLNARRVVMELILSDHPADCLVCAKNGACDLQAMAQRLEVNEIRYLGAQSQYRPDFSPSIIRDMDKCIMCRRCETMCNQVQTVGALSAVNRGFEAVVAPAFEQDLEKSVCTYCGQCVAVCPTGALTEVNHSGSVVADLANPKKTVIVQVAPAVRAALGEMFGMAPGTLVTGKLTAALRGLGFDYVFDTDFAADLTIMEEGTELLDRISKHLKGEPVHLPMLTSCCPAWVNFLEKQFPEFKDIPSTARSPQQMFGAIAKTYFADKIGVKREDLVVVSIMPCLAKKYECQRDEFKTNDNPDVDFAMSTRELGRLIKRANIDFNGLEDQDFDHPMGESSGAGVIFGVTGGVIEAAVRTAYEVFTKKPLKNIDFHELRGMDGIRHATVDFDGLALNIGIAHGLGNARELLESIRRGECSFHAIEIMSCPGGCIGGGGQPWHHGKQDILTARAKAIYTEDAQKVIRKSHENPYIVKLYEEFLGEPMSEKAHHLLHTNYFDRQVKFEEEK